MGVGQPWQEERRVNEEHERAKRMVGKRDRLRKMKCDKKGCANKQV